MTNLTKSQVEALMQGATKGPWEVGDWVGVSHAVYPSPRPDWGGEDICHHIGEGDACFIAALPDIAQTCLDLFARVEELEKELKDSRDIAQVWCDRCYALGYDPMKTP